jgi:ABC-type antimicrobial peptide transport system permease subunit
VASSPLEILMPRSPRVFCRNPVSSSHGIMCDSLDEMSMVGADIAQAGSHLKLVQGHLPGAVVSGNTLEIALRTDIADPLHWSVGTIIPLGATYMNLYTNTQTTEVLQLRVVGLFNLPRNADHFWHSEEFLNAARPEPGEEHFIAQSLVSNAALISLFSQSSTNSSSVVSDPSTLVWSYSLDTSHIQINDVDPILHGFQQLQIVNTDNSIITMAHGIRDVQTYFPTDTFFLYHDRLPLDQFPIASLTALVLCLALFFVTLMAGMLVDRQANAIALLRSRGATGGQIFGSLVTQAVLLGLLVLAIGPVIGVFLTRLLAQFMLPPADQQALTILFGNPLPLAASVSSFALATVCVMVLAIILAIWSTAKRDVLALRRETARATQRSLWQRLNLDVIAMIVALLSAGFFLYLVNSNTLDARARLLYLSPLALLEALCFLLATLLFILRGFPLFLRFGAWLAARRRGVASLIALAQMARAPRQSIRMTLLLALATAFAIFSLLFHAAQTQRIQAVSDYQAVADFSGNLTTNGASNQSWESVEQAYGHLPGVLSTALGYVNTGSAGSAQLSVPVTFQAVNGNTFAQTAHWSSAYSSQSLTDLLHQLVSARGTAIKQGVVPALVDANTWNTLHLAPGASFTLHIALMSASDQISFQAIAEVQHIPAPGDSSVPGVLADYQTFAGVYGRNTPSFGTSPVFPNYVWLRTSNNPKQLNALRSQLNTSGLILSPLYDRRVMEAQLAADPLYLALIGILLLGAATALLLALLGNLVASWLNVRSRLISFAALRALGATPRQIASTLAWEQVTVYSAAMLLGCFFGWLFSFFALPSLVFTSILPNQAAGVDNAAFYAAQNTPPVQIVIPPTLWLALGALVLLCVLALGMMMRIVSRPSIAQTLRLNED